MKALGFLLLLSCSALAQQPLPPPLAPPSDASRLDVCWQDRSRFFAESERARSYIQDRNAEIADLKKRLAEAEAKILKEESKP